MPASRAAASIMSWMMRVTLGSRSIQRSRPEVLTHSRMRAMIASVHQRTCCHPKRCRRHRLQRGCCDVFDNEFASESAPAPTAAPSAAAVPPLPPPPPPLPPPPKVEHSSTSHDAPEAHRGARSLRRERAATKHIRQDPHRIERGRFAAEHATSRTPTLIPEPPQSFSRRRPRAGISPGGRDTCPTNASELLYYEHARDAGA